MWMPCFSCLALSPFSGQLSHEQALHLPHADAHATLPLWECPCLACTGSDIRGRTHASLTWVGSDSPRQTASLWGGFCTLLGSGQPHTHRHPPHPAQTLTFHAGPFFCRDISAPLVCIFEYINAWGLLENKKHDGGFELTKCCLNFHERQENECYVFIKQVCHVLSLIFFDTVILFLIIYTEPSDMLQKRKWSEPIYFYNWKLKHPTTEEC